MTHWFYIAVGSVALNVLLLWYVRKVVTQVTLFTLDFVELSKVIAEYRSHLDSVHAMQTYYGDETLQNLITHSKQVVAEIKEFSEAFPFPVLEDLIEEEQDADEEEA